MQNNVIFILAAHTDDGELGCGGTIARFIEEGRTVYYIVFSTSKESVPSEFPSDILKSEVKQASRVLGIPDNQLIVFDYKVRELEYNRQGVLDDLIKLKKEFNPSMIFLPCKHDLHQDHLTIHNEGLRTFKQNTILGYELPWNNITFHTRHFISLTKAHLEKKIEALKCYKSQANRNYFDDEFILGLARTRGVQISANFAESFDVIRWVLK